MGAGWGELAGGSVQKSTWPLLPPLPPQHLQINGNFSLQSCCLCCLTRLRARSRPRFSPRSRLPARLLLRCCCGRGLVQTSHGELRGGTKGSFLPLQAFPWPLSTSSSWCVQCGSGAVPVVPVSPLWSWQCPCGCRSPSPVPHCAPRCSSSLALLFYLLKPRARCLTCLL